MRKLILSIAVLLVAVIPVRAQDSYPSAEIFGGYSYFSADITFDDPFDDDDEDFFDQREGIHGFGFSVAGNLTRGVGIVGDFSYHRKEFELPGDDLDITTFIFLFGPRFTARGERVEGFVHALIGGVRSEVEDFDSETDLALGFGGGIDIKATDSIAIRLAQLDYIPIRATNPFTDDTEWLHNLRFQIGAVFRFGGR